MSENASFTRINSPILGMHVVKDRSFVGGTTWVFGICREKREGMKGMGVAELRHFCCRFSKNF